MRPTEVRRSFSPRRSVRLIADVLAISFVVLLAAAPLPESEFRPTDPGGLLLALAPAAVLPFRRRWPLPSLGALIVLFGASALHGAPSPGAVVAAAITLFAFAASSSRRTTIIVTFVSVFATLALCLLATTESVFDPRTLQFGLTLGFGAAIGDGARSRRAYVDAITDRAIRAEESKDAEAKSRVAEERLRIARDLHDAVAHQITVISLNAAVAESSLETRPKVARQSLSLIRAASRDVLHEIGDLLEMLRSPDGSTPESAQPGLEELDSLIRRFTTAGLDVAAEVIGDTDLIPRPASQVAYRVIQESLTNSHKHGHPRSALLKIEVLAKDVTITVTNPTLAVRATRKDGLVSGGRGLIGLREMVEAVHGSMAAMASAGGYAVTATVPFGSASRR